MDPSGTVPLQPGILDPRLPPSLVSLPMPPLASGFGYKTEQKREKIDEGDIDNLSQKTRFLMIFGHFL